MLKNIRIIFLIIKFLDIAPPKCIQDKELLFDDLEYNHLCTLDSGEFGTVFLGKLTQGNQRKTVAVKVIHNPVLDIMSEISSMCKLVHPNILPIVGCNIQHRIILTEYMKNGNLRDVCRVSTVYLFS